MILIHSTSRKAKLRLVAFVRTQTDEAIVIAPTPKEIVPLARKHRPRQIFIYLPDRILMALTVHAFMRVRYPRLPVCLLPAVPGTKQLGDDWQSVVAKTLRCRTANGHIKKAAQP